jgi:pyruvate dehydrogenase E1 component
MPGDLFMERRIRSLVRWNAMAMVMRANDNEDGLGGHISSFSSSATLYDVGMNHFFRGTANGHPGDLVYYQGHSAPGMYARSFLEGVISEEQLENFRREVGGGGLSSYPHPWLMPDYWQFPYRIDGPWADSGDLSGPRHEVPKQAWAGRSSRPQDLVFSGRR